MRPTTLHVGGVLRWVINTRNPDTMLLKDADSTPTITVRKNGSAISDTVTITKRAATTGIYDCEYNPAGDVEGDVYNIREVATVTGTTTPQASYDFSWPVTVVALERGTDGANTTAPDNAGIGHAAASAATAATQATNAATSAANIQTRIPAALDSGRMIAKAESVTGPVTLATSQPNYAPAKAGDAMTLTGGERTAVANEVEAQIIDDTDSERVLQAIVDKIAAANPSLDDLTLGAIASAVRTELAAELARIDAAITSRASQASVDVVDDFIDTEIGTLLTRTDNIQSRLPAALIDGRIDSNVSKIGNAPVQVDTGGEGIVTFLSNATVATAGDTFDANIVQVGGENIHDDGDGRMEVVASGIDAYEINAGNTGWITVDNPTGDLAIEGFYDGCLIVITDASTGISHPRWITAHFLSGGDAGFNPNIAFTFMPVAGDTIKIYRDVRWQSNVIAWRNTQPGNLDSNSFVPANVTAINGNTSAVSTFRTWLDNNYLGSVVDRIGAFTGSGVNTILGFLRAIMRTDATLPSDVGGTFASTTDSLQAIRDRGDAAWLTGEGGSGGSSGGTNGTGAYKITVTVSSTVDNALLHGAKVLLAGTATYDHTNQSGVAVLNVAANATYAVSVIAPPGFVNPADLSVPVAESNVTRSVSLAAKQISPPSGANECRVAVDVIDQFGSPYNGVTVSAVVDSSVTGASEAGILNKYARGVKTANGRAELDLIQGVTYSITFEKDHQSKSFSYEVPNSSTAVATESF